ncbi:piggyBac transposable element-derived protein 4-like isoform X2 [Nerophis ophidion]|uniref:piggyBac transposable element-derived protein 4-like isoform X2 n=1 Tax=Nerophis ophidion TaxID=159077 RepID=UPI002ADF43FB|nr:piggyBac transposable element-derived protein 4-like isoform X2 [Nerophis ophidion]
MLRELVRERLMAAADEIFWLFERTIASYEEELSRTREEKERQRQQLEAAYFQQLVGRPDGVTPLPQERSSPLTQEVTQLPHIKEEEEELCLRGPKLLLTGVSMETENHEAKLPESSRLLHSPSKQPSCSGSPQHMSTEAEGGSPADNLLAPLSDTEVKDEEDIQEHLNTDWGSDMRTYTNDKHSECSEKNTAAMKKNFCRAAHDAVMEPLEDDDILHEDFSSESQESSDDFGPDIKDPCSSEEEEEEKEEKNGNIDSQDVWRSRNREILWSPSHEVALPFLPPPIWNSGPTNYAVSRIRSPETAFGLFFPEDIMQHLLQMTNLQGQRSVTAWQDINMVELRAYLGLLILSGIFKSRHESTKSMWDGETGRSVFAATMSKKRFVSINRAVSFDDELSRPTRHIRDNLAPIRDVWTKWNTLLPRMFNPSRDVCVDEQFIPFRGHCSFKLLIPPKPAKYGLKIWTLCDVETSYAWNMQVHTGTPASAAAGEVDQGMRVVLELSDGLEGHTITTNNFFTSFPLAAELQKKKMALVGTIRTNKQELPPQLVKIGGRKVLSSKFAFTEKRTLVSYVAKKGKNVLLMSTKHREPKVQDTGKKEPQMILDYNLCKGAVNRLNQACAPFTCRRRTHRWPITLFYHMVDVSCYNAYVLFTAVRPEWNRGKSFKRRLFLEEIGKSLTTPAILQRSRLPKALAAANLVEQTRMQQEEEQRPRRGSLGKRKQCSMCTRRKRVVLQCNICGKATCKNHLKMLCDSCQ